MLHQPLLIPVLAAALALSPFQSGGKVSKSDLRQAGKELAEMYRVDQEDQKVWDEAKQDEIIARTDLRRARTAEIVTGGLLGAAVDYHHASWLLQHGEGTDDFLVAHILATTAAFEGYDAAKFMSAAALDRFAMYVGQTQRFGSQTFDEAGQDLGDTSGLLNESIVKLFSGGASGLQGRATEGKARSAKQLKNASKFLAKSVKSAQALSTSTKQADIGAWKELLARTRGYVDAGSLKGEKDFYNAAAILVHAADRESLLMAHIMATSAGLLEHKQARELYAQTLDRYMLALERAPLFDAKLAEGTELPELAPILILHERIRERILDGP